MLASIPDIVCIAQTTLIVVNNTLLVYVRRVPFFWFDRVSDLSTCIHGANITSIFAAKLQFSDLRKKLASLWSLNGNTILTGALFTLHTRAVWKLDRDFKILRKCLIYEIFFTKELKLTLNKQSLDIFTPQVYLCKYISFVFSTTYTMISFRSKRRFLSLVFILKIVPKQLLASGSVNIDEYLPLLFNKL